MANTPGSPSDYAQILVVLRRNEQDIKQAIAALERLTGGDSPHRGRPPLSPREVSEDVNATAGVVVRSKRIVSPEARARMAEAQKKRWADLKANDSAGESATKPSTPVKKTGAKKAPAKKKRAGK